MLKLLISWHRWRLKKHLHALYPGMEERAEALLAHGAYNVENVLFNEGRTLESILVEVNEERDGFYLSVQELEDE